MIMLVNFNFNIFNNRHSENYRSNMEQNLRQKEFLVDFQRLTEQPSTLLELFSID